jgi:hypothetical protein
MTFHISKQQRYSQIWLDAAQSCAEGVMCDEIMEIASLTELPEDLQDLWDDYDDIENYDEQFDYWLDCIYAHSLMLVIEQASYQGALLTRDMRSLRLALCSPNLLTPFNMMLRSCPKLILAQLVAAFSIAVSVERVQRTGNPDWSPLKAIPEPEPRAFFCPPLVTLVSG